MTTHRGPKGLGGDAQDRAEPAELVEGRVPKPILDPGNGGLGDADLLGKLALEPSPLDPKPPDVLSDVEHSEPPKHDIPKTDDFRNEDLAKRDLIRNADSDIGRRFRDLRAKQGLHQAQIAKLMGLAQATMSRLESGHANWTAQLLLRASHVLDVSPAQLLGAVQPSMPWQHRQLSSAWDAGDIPALIGLIATRASEIQHGPRVPRIDEGTDRERELVAENARLRSELDDVRRAAERDRGTLADVYLRSQARSEDFATVINELMAAQEELDRYRNEAQGDPEYAYILPYRAAWLPVSIIASILGEAPILVDQAITGELRGCGGKPPWQDADVPRMYRKTIVRRDTWDSTVIDQERIEYSPLAVGLIRARLTERRAAREVRFARIDVRLAQLTDGLLLDVATISADDVAALLASKKDDTRSHVLWVDTAGRVHLDAMRPGARAEESIDLRSCAFRLSDWGPGGTHVGRYSIGDEEWAEHVHRWIKSGIGTTNGVVIPEPVRKGNSR